MNKKGIEPLIATILIIGFTVALAVLLLSWIYGFFGNIKETTIRQTEEQLSLQDFGIKIIRASHPYDPYNPEKKRLYLQLENLKPTKIEGFLVRIYGQLNDKTIEYDLIDSDHNLDETEKSKLPLDGLEINSFNMEYNKDFFAIIRVEVIPKIIINNRLVVAESQKSPFDLSGLCLKCADIKKDEENEINIDDLNILKNNYNKCIGNDGYDVDIDLTGDGCISGDDLNCLKIQYNKLRRDSPYC